MKKVLSTVAALGLVAGMSASASALEWTISGDYTVQGVNLNHSSANSGLSFAGPRAGNFNNGTLNINGPDDEQNSDAYYWHQFRTDVTMKVNDNIKVVSEIYMIDAYTFWEDTTGCATEDGNYVNVFKLWMQYTTPFGLFEIGRMPNGMVLNDFTNTDLQGDGIKFSPTLPEPFVLSFTTQKVDEDDSLPSNLGFGNETDSDYDYYHIQAGYHTEKIVIDTALRYWDDARGKAGVKEVTDTERVFTEALGWVDVTTTTPGVAEFNREYWTWWLAGDLTFGKFYAKGELSYTFGDWKSWEDDYNLDDVDIDAWALMLDVGAKIGDLDVGLMYFFLEGEDDDDDEMTAYMMQSGGAGGAFTPYYILTGPQTAMLNQDILGPDSIDQEMRGAGAHCLGVHADFQVTPKLSLHGAMAYAWADDTESLGDMIDEDGNTDERDDDYGWEIDVGVAYKLLDNLTYSLNIGYLDTGDFFAVAYHTDVDDNRYSLETDDTNDIVLVTNTLTMEF